MDIRRGLILCALFGLHAGCVSSGLSVPEAPFADVNFDTIRQSDVPQVVLEALKKLEGEGVIRSCARSHDRASLPIYRVTLSTSSVYFFSGEGTFLGRII